MSVLILHHTDGELHIGCGTENPPTWEQLDTFFCENFLAFMMFNRGFYPVWDAWLRSRHTEFDMMNVIFDGHADHKEGQWRLCANEPYDRPVQDFVDEHDGKAMLILLLCCNPRNRGRVTSQKSLVVYSRSAMSLHNMQSRRSRQIMYIPDHGDLIGTTDEERLNAIALENGYVPVSA